MNDQIRQLLKEVGPGTMSSTAYDTAWVARLGEIDWELSSHALNWLCEHQLPDGSWGAERPFYYHDRIISTLSAMIALTYRGRRQQDKVQIENGLLALERITSGATLCLQAYPNGATVGFEMIVPTLVAEAERLGIIKQQGERILGRLAQQRKMKMEKLAGLKINRYLTASFSTEMAGDDSIHLLDIDNLQEPNGSITYSPSSTAYFALKVKPGNEAAIRYLKNTKTNGGLPFVSPFDIFERCWLLWNLTLLDDMNHDIQEQISSHLDHLQKNWVENQGVSFTENSALFDSDDTSVTFHVLTHFGREVDIQSVLSYEEEKHFRCYQYEINPSIGVNVHTLNVLRNAGYPKNHPTVSKILNFLYETRLQGSYWFDKWHVSPYYITSHVIISCLTYDSNLVQDAINWVLQTQNPNGSWGFYGEATAEETAYCLQALKIWERAGNRLPQGIINTGASWLRDNSEPPYPWLWIGKTLYYPRLIIKSAILTALKLVQD